MMTQRFLVTLLLTAAIASGADAVESADAGEEEEAVRIVCIGDSITQGRQGGGNADPTYSYRYPLWQRCVDAELEVDFVGSMSEGFNGSPDWADHRGRSFDREHEGHWGWTSWAIADALPAWVEGYRPDIALIMLGSNGVKDVEDPVAANIAAFRRIIATLRERNPEVVVVIGQCFQEWEPFPALRAGMRGLAEELASEDSPVLLVDHSPGWISHPEHEGTHTVDWVHPNPEGDRRIAEGFFATIRSYLERREAGARRGGRGLEGGSPDGAVEPERSPQR